MQIALLQTTQHHAMLNLLAELNAHYHADSPATAQTIREHFYSNLMAPESALWFVVASTQNDDLLGFAGFSLYHSLTNPLPAMAKQCQLKELFVSERARGLGIGTALMRWLAAYALTHQCARIDWPVHAANARGLAFYRSLGAEQQDSRLTFRLNQAAMLKLATAAQATQIN